MEPVDLYARKLGGANLDDDVSRGLFPTDCPHRFGMTAFDRDDRTPHNADEPRETDLTARVGLHHLASTFHRASSRLRGRGEILEFAITMNKAIADGMHLRAVRFDEGAYLDLGTYDEILEMERHFRAE
jgi:hypothetical protein